MGERHNGIVEVTGSIPVRSTKKGNQKRLSFFHNMYAMYIIRSKKTDRYYTGHTDEVKRRMVEHNAGMSKYTMRDRPWELMYTEYYETRSAAMKREKEIKSKKSRKYIEELIKAGERPDTTES